jgi:hypothetical protein
VKLSLVINEALHHEDMGELSGVTVIIMYLFLYFVKEKNSYMICTAKGKTHYVQLLSCNLFTQNEVLITVKEEEYGIGKLFPPHHLLVE